MKRTILLTCLLLCTNLGIWAQEEDLKVSFTPEALVDLPGEGDSQDVIVSLTGADAWTAKVEDGKDFIKIAPETGGDGDKVTVTVAPNESGEIMEGDIIFTVGEKEFKFHVSQKAQEKQEVSVSFTPEALLDLPGEGDSQDVIVSLTGADAWTAKVEDGKDFIKIAPETGGDGDKVTVTVAPNESGKILEGNIIFAAGEKEFRLHVIQNAANATFSVKNENNREIDKIDFEDAEGEETIKVSSNYNWTASIKWEGTSKDWLVISPESAEAGDDREVKISVKANTEGEPRTATITFAAGSGDNTVTQTITVTQNAATATFVVKYKGQETDKIDFEDIEGEETIKVSSNYNWTASIKWEGTSKDWLVISPESAEAGDDKEVIISVMANTEGEPRTATITFTAGSGDNMVTKTLTVTQNAATATFVVKYMGQETDKIDFEDIEGEETIKVSSNYSWTASIKWEGTSKDWLVVSPESAEAGDDMEVIISVMANTDGEPRTATITFTAGSGDNTVTKTLTISQRGKPYINIDLQEDQNVSEDGSKFSVKVESNREWTIIIGENDQSWIDVDPKSGDGDKDVTVTVKKADTIDQRSATITFKVDDETFKTLTINQLGKPDIKIDPEKFNIISEDGMSLDIKVVSNRDWKVNSIPEWIKMDKAGKVGNTTLEITIEENPDTTKREAIIIFVADKVEQSLVITQKGQPFVKAISSLDDLKNVSEKGKEKIRIKVESNVNWDVSSTPDWISAEKISPTELSISINPNPYTTEREATIILVIEKNPQEITISQIGTTYKLKDKGWEKEFELKDANNSTNTLKEGIRSGNILQLPKDEMEPQMTGVGVDYYKWEYEYNWSLGKRSFNDDNVPIPSVNSETVMKLECTAVLKDLSGKIVDSQIIYSRDVTVYPKPSANLSLQLKGDGTSNTWIVQNYKKNEKEWVVIGLYNETTNSVTYEGTISEYSNGVGWIKLSLSNNGSEKPCLCIVRDYGNDVKITSDVYLESGIKSWDGSTYNKLSENEITRGDFDATGIESVTNDNQIDEPAYIYSINGTQTNKVNRGMNIIRMKDGTVRKVFVK